MDQIKRVKIDMNKENYEKEEWGGWKIVSEMLNNPDASPDANGVYLTSKCYQELYEFVMAQKEKAREEVREYLTPK